MGSLGHSRSWSRLPVSQFVLVLGGGLLATLIRCSGPAFAVHDTGVFELDGNAAASSADDFNTIYSGPGLSFDRAFVNDSSLPDTSFHGGTNLDTQPISAWSCITNDDPRPINDLRHAYAAAYMINGNLHLFFGGVRGGNGGNSWFGLWLFQKPVHCNPATGVFSGQKTNGDLFIASHLNVTGEDFAIKVYRWTDPTPGTPESGDEFLDELEVGGDCSGSDPHAASEHVCGVLNTGSISVAWEGSPLAARRYLEGGLNLSALFQEHAFGPVCYSAFMAETRGGLPLGARPFDYALGDLSTCASVTVDVTTDPGGDPQQFDFTLAGGPDAINKAFQLADTAVPHTTFDLKPGSYLITETVPGVWDLTNANCVGGPFGGGGAYLNGGVFSLNFGDQVTCTFHNVKKRGRITVDKVTAPSGDPQLFDFTVAGGPDAVNDMFQLADATAPHTTISLRPGAYSITEAARSGWDIGAISCSGGQFGAGGGAYTNGGTINLDWGDLVTCTFSNTKRGSITVDKVTAPVGDPQTFDFLVAGGPDSLYNVFQLTDAATPHTTTNLRPGTYSLTETAPAGWDFGSAACVGGSFGAGGSLTNGGTFTLTPGAQIICTVTNIRRSRITVDVVTTPGGAPQLFKFTLKGKPTVGGKALRAIFQLADATTPFTIEVQPGWFKLVQKKVKGWTLANITCVGGPFGAGNPYDNKSKFTLLPTDIVTCTYSNTKP